MKLSAFTSILKVIVQASSRDSLKEIETLLKNVLTENSILHGPNSFSPLLSSFEASDDRLQHQLSFFDNCVCRVAKKPVHYQDLLGSLVENASKPVSPIVAAITEQWPFVVKSGGDAESAVGTWIAKILGNLKQAGEDSKALKAARDTLMEATENKRTESTLKKALKGTEEGSTEDGGKESGTAQPTSPSSGNEKQVVDLEEVYGALPTEGKTHNGLHRWEKDELEVSVEQGRVAELILCLCSEHEEVRKQAFANITRFMSKLRVS
jgi:nucleolar pre-ribosomal-associated protein 1